MNQGKRFHMQLLRAGKDRIQPIITSCGLVACSFIGYAGAKSALFENGVSF